MEWADKLVRLLYRVVKSAIKQNMLCRIQSRTQKAPLKDWPNGYNQLSVNKNYLLNTIIIAP